MVFFFFLVFFFATVVVVDFGAVSAFGATVEFEDAGFAVASVVDVVRAAGVAVVVGPAFTLFLLFTAELGAVVAVNTDVGVVF